MELKVFCPCGQKYKFDVEPVNGQMPFTVNCPVCGIDGTPLANNLLQQMPAPAAVPVAVLAPVAAAAAPAAVAAPPSKLRLNRETAPPPMAPPVPPIATPPPIGAPPVPRGRPTPGAYTPAPAVPKYMRDNPALQNNNLLMGVLGGVIGAILDVAVVFGVLWLGGPIIILFAHLMWGIPLGIIMGAVIGGGARILYHGTDFQLGALCAVIAFITIGLTFMLMFGLFGMVFAIFGLVFGISTAFKVAS